MTAAEVSLDVQIRCAGRELGMRRNTYPKWVASGRMTQEEADREIAGMDAIYATLKALKAGGVERAQAAKAAPDRREG